MIARPAGERARVSEWGLCSVCTSSTRAMGTQGASSFSKELRISGAHLLLCHSAASVVWLRCGGDGGCLPATLRWGRGGRVGAPARRALICRPTGSRSPALFLPPIRLITGQLICSRVACRLARTFSRHSCRATPQSKVAIAAVRAEISSSVPIRGCKSCCFLKMCEILRYSHFKTCSQTQCT